MIKRGKPINLTLLSRTFSWKKEIQNRNRIICQEMLLNANHSTTERCLICENATREVTEIEGIAYGHCENCNHLQASKRPVTSFLRKLYESPDEKISTQNFVYIHISSSDLLARVNEIAKPKVEFVKDNIVFSEMDLWLDIGSGTGDVLVAARDTGFKILGLEVSTSEVRVAHERSIPTLQVFYDGSQKLSEFQTAKVISIFNILEHTLEPLLFLRNIVDQMNSNAYLVIEVPRLESVSSLIQYLDIPNRSRHIYPPEHLNIFSDKSMDVTLNKLNLSREATWYFGSDAIEIFSYVSTVIRPEYFDGLELFSEEINQLQNQIDQAGLSDVMLLIARKS